MALPVALPVPRDWQVFEDFCRDLFAAEWSDPETKKYGRPGQKQEGVDVFGRRNGRWQGVQCKLRRTFPETRLTEREVREEVEAALTFTEAKPLETLVIATTAPADAKLDDLTARLTAEGSFRVVVYGWQELCDRLRHHPLEWNRWRRALGGPEEGPPGDAPADENAVLGKWFALVADEHRRLVDHFERPVELQDLEKAWVRLELRMPGNGEASISESTGDLERHFGRRRLEDFLALEPEAHPWVTRRWLVEGDPGSGKTTLLRYLAARLARAQGRILIPVFVSLPRLVEPMRPLLDYLSEEIGTLCGPRLPEVLGRAGSDGRLLVLLDGLDEVAPERRDRVPRLLRKLEADWPRAHVVLASRPIGRGRLPEKYHKLLLEPFDDEQRREFLEKWFTYRQKPAAAGEAAAHFDSDRSLRELSHNPLHLTLLTVLWEKGVQAPTRRSKLYEAIFDLLLEGRHKEPPVAIPATVDVREALRHLAFGMTRDDLPAEDPKELERRLWDEDLDGVRTRLEKIWEKNLLSFLDEVYERTYLLGPHDGPRAGWRFWHRTFREALTAEKLKELFEEDEAALFMQLEAPEAKARTEGQSAEMRKELFLAFHQGDEGRWSEPFALLAGHLPDPDALVRSLAEANRALGLRALATAEGLKDETLTEILELSDDWEERRKVFERLPELIDDPLRALALVNQLRQRTRNGNDLFFLDQAVAAVAEKWPDARRGAEQLQARLYDHIPPPPEELFRWIETRDGRVELWREIPEGEFLMGSPSDEEGRYDLEGPRHQVKIASFFQMAAVPVTVAQYAAFDPEYRSYRQGQVPDDKLPTHPVERVTWYQAFAFCRWFSASLPWAKGARLPREEEWEYACRAGTESRYWSGNKEADLRGVGWYRANSDDRTHRVGRKPANPWGLYDVHGNVWEWTASEGAKDYSGREGGVDVDPSAVDSADLAGTSGARRVARGGCYWFQARDARSAHRIHGIPGFGIRFQGFRVCLPAVSE